MSVSERSKRQRANSPRGRRPAGLTAWWHGVPAPDRAVIARAAGLASGRARRARKAGLNAVPLATAMSSLRVHLGATPAARWIDRIEEYVRMIGEGAPARAENEPDPQGVVFDG